MSGEVQLRRKDGELVEVEFRAVANIEPGVHLSVVRDITERRLTDQRALRAQRMESLGTLAGGIAHDLNNALTPILLSTEMLRDEEGDPARRDLLAGIADSARRGARMVRQLLSFARGVEGERVDVSVGAIIAEIETFANNTFLKSIRVRTEVAADLRVVSADQTQLHQVLLNLCVNARDAMPEGGTLTLTAANVEVDAALAARRPDAVPGTFVRITVEDTGVGMPAPILERVFDPFFTTKPFGHGTGLGLPTALAIIRSHNGFMWIDSAPMRGTRVEVYLPPGSAPTASAPVSEPLPPPAHGETVLVIDDEAGVREAMRRVLEDHGYRVRLAASGAEGIAVYATHRAEVALVIVDMMMPGMDGPGTMGALRRIDSAVRIAAVTGLLEDVRVARAQAAGASRVLGKPFTPAALLRVVHDALSPIDGQEDV